MSAPSNIPSELFPLLGELADEQLSEAGQEKLLGILRGSDDARTYYLEYMELHARLQWKHNGEDAIDRPVVSTSVPIQPNFVGGWALSYMVATVVLAAMLLSAWAYKISHVGSPSDGVVNNPWMETPSSPKFIGQITGMKDCRWDEDEPGTIIGASVPLGREYSLESGLLQIIYKTGANVILEGPCVFRADSDDGGYLQLGKLVARVEKNNELGICNKESKGRQSDIHHSSFTTHDLFSITTPTVVITDLGTEFGVEVAVDGATESHVIEGSVDVRVLDSKSSGKNHLRLEAGDAVRVEPNVKTIAVVPFASERFVRMLAAPPDRRAEETYIKAVLADKPLGYWPLNEPAHARRFADLSGNGFHGSAMGNVATGAAGPLPGDSNAVELSGDGYIDVGRRDEFALENGFTFEAWIFLDDDCWTGDSLTHIRVISATSSDGRHQKSGWSVGFKPFAVGKRPFCCFGPHGYQTGATVLRDADVPVSRWVHVALVYDSDNVATLYLNGKRRASALDGRPVKIGPTWVSIGFGTILRDEYWRGRLAHVAVYPTTLSGQQIINHYKYFEKSAGGNVTDSSATTQENERR